MKDYYQKSMRALQLAFMSKRTQQCRTRSVRMLVDLYHKTPDLINEQELQDYFLHRKNVDKKQMKRFVIFNILDVTLIYSPNQANWRAPVLTRLGHPKIFASSSAPGCVVFLF